MHIVTVVWRNVIGPAAPPVARSGRDSERPGPRGPRGTTGSRVTILRMSSLREGGPNTSRGAIGIPFPVQLAAAAWFLYALVEFFAAGDSFTAGRDAEADRIATQLGPDSVSGTPAVAATGVISVLVGILTGALVLLLLSGRGWTRFALPTLGGFGVVVLAWDGRWHTVALMTVLIVGTVALMAPATHRFLAGR